MSDYSAACPVCDTRALDDFLMERASGSRFETRYNNLADLSVPETVNLGRAEAFCLVALDRPSPGSYGEFHQGYEGEGFVVFKYKDEFYKKYFRQDSYDGLDFDRGDLKKVTGKIKTITDWE